MNSKTIWHWLKKLGVQSRSRINATRLAKATTVRLPFTGDDREAAYILGISTGDFAVRRMGFLIDTQLDTGRRGMEKLFTQLFGKYAKLYSIGRINPTTGKPVKRLFVRLDLSFEFMLHKVEGIPHWVRRRNSLFFAFVAELFDAEGHIEIRRCEYGLAYMWQLSNTNLLLIEDLQNELEKLGFRIHRHIRKPQGLSKKIIHDLRIYQLREIQKLLAFLPVRNQEKIKVKELVLRCHYGMNAKERRKVMRSYTIIKNYIQREKEQVQAEAKQLYLRKKQEKKGADAALPSNYSPHAL